MASETVIRKITAFVLIAWFVAPVCCCSAKSGGEGSAAVAVCCQAEKPQADAETSPDSGEADCPCGKLKMAGGKTEDFVPSVAVDVPLVPVAIHWQADSVVEAGGCCGGQMEKTSLPPPVGRWFALVDCWLL